MASIASLNIYPIKSCRGVAISSATLGCAGLESAGVGDREWMVVDADTGMFLTQRQAPRMALIAPALQLDVLCVAAPGMPDLHLPIDMSTPGETDIEVTVWNHVCRAFDAGDAAAGWFSKCLGRRLRLVRFDPAHRRLSDREWTGDVEAPNRFSDGYPILLISRASLADLNDRLIEAGREALPMDRFRPNIVVDGVDPYDEDHFDHLHSPGIRLKPVKPCPRCPIPSIDQATAEFGADPLDILAQYRADLRTGGVVFGQNVIVLEGAGATIAIGQQFGAEWNF